MSHREALKSHDVIRNCYFAGRKRQIYSYWYTEKLCACVLVCTYCSAASWQAASGKEGPDGYYANEASCLLHWQTPHNSLLVLLQVRKYFIPRRHFLLPPLYFLREGISIDCNFIHTLLPTFLHYSPASARPSICTVTVMNVQTGKASLSICWLLQYT